MTVSVRRRAGLNTPGSAVKGRTSRAQVQKGGECQLWPFRNTVLTALEEERSWRDSEPMVRAWILFWTEEPRIFFRGVVLVDLRLDQREETS